MNKKKFNKTTNFKLPTFLRGFASTFDITGQTLLDIPDFKTGFQRDADALRGDWILVGNDIRNSMNQYAHE
jgi:hypothetical protein